MARKFPAHPEPIERNCVPVIVFVTVCTAGRRPILAEPAKVAVLQECWRLADSWLVGRYVVMPDHIHLFCSPKDDDIGLDRWVKYWKALATRRWPEPLRHRLWQRDFWDTQLRSSDGYDEKWEYVRTNPVRHGWVENPEAWPFQGEMARLEWF